MALKYPNGRHGKHLSHVWPGNPTGTPQSPHFMKVGIVMDNDLDQAKGRVKQAVGDLTDNKDLKNEGKTDETAGKVKEFLGDAKNKADDLVDKAKDKVNER